MTPLSGIVRCADPCLSTRRLAYDPTDRPTDRPACLFGVCLSTSVLRFEAGSVGDHDHVHGDGDGSGM